MLWAAMAQAGPGAQAFPGQQALPWLIGWGVGFGILGAVLGSVGGSLAPRGKARPVVMALAWLVPVWALAGVAMGIVAWANGWHASMALVPGLLGALWAPLGLFFVWLFRMRYRQAEERKLAAEEL
jgi:hypothetical protein